ncbi:MAG: hypothetical protein K2H64_05430 [Desulfovibrio sp.]|nr:hypothetical protein [Desulfovibrio sp.]
MIIVDGRKSEKKISDFANLEEILASVRDDDSMQGRVITDVIVNNENFSEIYPHQAEDMESASLESVEVRSEPAADMAVKVAAEMPKVAKMMAGGATNVARLLRESKQSEALELFQDLLDVTRDFMGMLSHLRDRFLGGADEDFARRTEKFSDLLSEMSEVMENEDWILLSDLLEFEFVPACEEWRTVGEKIRAQLEAAKG